MKSPVLTSRILPLIFNETNLMKLKTSKRVLILNVVVKVKNEE